MAKDIISQGVVYTDIVHVRTLYNCQLSEIDSYVCCVGYVILVAIIIVLAIIILVDI